MPETPTDLQITGRTYSSISVQWKSGFDGGWPQRFSVALDHRLWHETNETYFTFTSKMIFFFFYCIERDYKSDDNLLELQHAQYYNISVRAVNHLGQSINETSIRMQTDNVYVRREGKSL